MSLLLALVALASASEYYLEGPHVPGRSAIVQIQRQAEDLGHPGRIVRRFVDGEGWRFLIRIEGFTDEGSAIGAARELADGLGLGLDLLYTDGTSATYLRRLEPGGELGGEPASGAPIDEEDPIDEASVDRARELLEQAATAHGVDRETLTRWMEGPSLMEYRRSLADGTVVDHRWATREGAIYVEVNAVEGDVRSSRLLLQGEQGWLEVEGGSWIEQDPVRLATVVADFGPAAVLPLVFVLRQAMETRREFGRMQHAGAGEIGGVPTEVLGYGGDRASAALVIEIGQEDGLVRRASFSGGAVVHEFDDFRPVGDLILPHEIVSIRGGAFSDTVVVTHIETGDSLLDSVFGAAGGDDQENP
ncbi:MAG TPA: hypothetical protein ENK18_28275 [Deltaproteobacteria bacterium]|nr:hypothetical protein [Deltaproteobacteria bacterium]